VRAKQDRVDDHERRRGMALLIHGDAAFAGQGLVAESLDLSDLGGYRIGGTIHFVVNNQIGFTTLPTYSRSGPYCTEIAKIVQAPILHVNGDDPEAVVHVSRIATEFRQRFKRDIVIDMFCYRRHGHNESDEPMFTQPLMYKMIAGHKSVKEVYAARLEAEGVVTPPEVAALDAELREKLDKALEAAAQYKPNKADWLEGRWAGFTVAPGEEDRKGQTAVETEKLVAVGTIIGNPLDAGFAALTSQDAYLNCIETLLDDPGIDALLLQEELPRAPGTERKEANLKAVNAIAARARKPIAFVTMISHGMTDYSRSLRSELPNIAFLQ
jgi:2-oxoglutarate dehydrogenase E1 component